MAIVEEEAVVEAEAVAGLKNFLQLRVFMFPKNIKNTTNPLEKSINNKQFLF